jgi:DNA-binding SARP family transcriptional activator
VTTLTAEIAPETAEALEQLAPLLHPEADDPLALLLQDALRSYVWIIRQQLNERVVASISQKTKAYLETQPDAPDDIAKMLVCYIPAESFEHVRSALAEARAEREGSRA